MKTTTFICLTAAATMPLLSCSSSSTNDDVAMIKSNPRVAAQAVDSLKSRYADLDVERASKGVAQAAALWRTSDGSTENFVDFCVREYVNDETERRALFEKLSDKLEIVWGHFNMIDLKLKQPRDEAGAEPAKIDMEMAGYNVGAHFNDDMFASKVAFTAIINFPSYSLSEKQQQGEGWSALQWGYARLGDVFTMRVPAALKQATSKASADAEAYIASYNIAMGALRSEAGEALFPADMLLISHWGLRDELKANYADAQRGLEKQRMIYAVMGRIVEQQIPAKVINNPSVQWNPISNKVAENGKEVSAPSEPDTRYEMFLRNFRAQHAEDPYTPQTPTYIQRAFDGAMEFSKEEVRDMFIRFISSEQVAEVAKLIAQRLGRPLEPFDIWYDGFKARSGISEDELSARTAKLYPTAADFEQGLPGILRRLGFTAADAQRIYSEVEVDASRGAGHAWGAMMKGDKAHLRTRVAAGGMDYKGYNIAVHEFGHNVEQTISLHDVEHYIMNGVPNTSFTEALAFVFQKRDLDLLGISEKNPNKTHLKALDIFWGCYEIMGVSLVDMAAWEWLYANPAATPAQLRENVLRIAREIWNTYYAPTLGTPDSPILAIYSHMIDYPLYLPNYPMGHLIEFQLEEHLRGKNFADEVMRIYRMGRLTPQLWMKRATGSEVSIEPMLKAAEKAVKQLKAGV
ncbi:MAG: hypothetical protein LBF67_09245 [Prevotellaceae bacterium]|jgi:hypothetical protein|nr:hypothetical protein [Prevotellaceae bacterium]